MINTNQYFNKIVIRVLILLALESILFFVFSEQYLPLITGVIVGGIFNLIFFKIIHLNIISAIEKTPSQAKRIMVINYIIRYIISGILLFVSAKSIYLDFFTTALGLLSVKIVVYIYNLYSLIFEKKEKKTF